MSVNNTMHSSFTVEQYSANASLKSISLHCNDSTTDKLFISNRAQNITKPADKLKHLVQLTLHATIRKSDLE